MKKTFPLTHQKINPERMVESIRAEVHKYLRRERNKKLPEGMDYWDFDCKVGATAESAKVLHVTEISKAIGELLVDGNEACYVELLAKAARRQKRSKESIR